MNTRHRLSSSIALLLILAVVLVVVLSGGSAATGRSASRHAGDELTTRHTPLGQILVDGHGRSLYLFEADGPNRSTLSRAGLKVWPALNAQARPLAAGGVSAAHVSLIHSGRGIQVAYFGHPLYYFAGDQGPGDATGQGLREFGALWFVISSNGNANRAAQPASAAVAPSTTGYAY